MSWSAKIQTDCGPKRGGFSAVTQKREPFRPCGTERRASELPESWLPLGIDEGLRIASALPDDVTRAAYWPLAAERFRCRSRRKSGSSELFELASLAGGGQRPVGRAIPEPPLHLGRVGAEERSAHSAVARLELRVLDILGEIGGLREEVIDAKAA